MWVYEKKLQYPVKIKTPNAKTAKYIISQLGGPDGELAASLRYMNQRYTAQPDKVKGILTDVATEELAHVEMISAILYQLTDGLTPEQIKEAGFDAYFVDHTLGVYPQSAAGVPFTAAYFQSKGDPITDLKIWRQSRRHAAPMTTSCGCARIRMCVIPSSSCGSVRSCISSGLARHSARCRTI